MIQYILPGLKIRVKDLKGNKLLLVQKSIIRESLASSTYEDLVAAQSKALAAMSAEMAKAILELVQKGQ